MLSYLLLLLLSSYRAVIHNVPRKRLLRKILLWPFYREGDTQLVDNHDCYERQDIIENTENYIVNNNDKIKLLECQNQLLYFKMKVIIVRLIRLV